MVKIAGCSKHETFGYCVNCAFDSLKAERDALRAELDEAQKNIANARLDLEWPIVKERDKLRAERDELLVIIRRCLRLAREHRDFHVLGYEPFWKAVGDVEGLNKKD